MNWTSQNKWYFKISEKKKNFQLVIDWHSINLTKFLEFLARKPCINSWAFQGYWKGSWRSTWIPLDDDFSESNLWLECCLNTLSSLGKSEELNFQMSYKRILKFYPKEQTIKKKMVKMSNLPEEQSSSVSSQACHVQPE